MDIHEFYRSIKIACHFLDKYEVIIVGSQSIHAHYFKYDQILNASHEIDVTSWDDPQNHDSLMFHGEGSPFHIDNGYYIDPVDIDMIILPDDYKDRLVRVCNSETDGRVGYCISTEDLMIAKLMAGREKDHVFCNRLIELGLVDVEKSKTLLRDLTNRYNYSDSDFEGSKTKAFSFLERDITPSLKM